MKAREEIKKLAEFVPTEARLQILESLLEYYPNKGQLAGVLNCNPLLIKTWQRNKDIKKEHFPAILALALQECPSTKSIIKNSLNGLSFLCSELEIIEKEEKNNVSEFMEALDEKSRTVVWHLIMKGHAKISELSALISLNDTLTLNKIKETINPTAKKILGTPILLFKQAGFDSKKKFLFSWWIDESLQLAGGKNKEIVEISTEKNFLIATIALPDLAEEDVMVSIENNNLSVFGKNDKTSFFKKIPLYCPVKKIKEKTFNNGILEIKLEKQNEAYQISKEISKSNKKHN